MADMIKVRSATDFTVVINAPEIPLVKTWPKRGSIYPIQRDTLFQAFYNTSLKDLVEKGMLVVEDKAFLVEVGLIEDEKEALIELTPAQMEKLIGVVPLWEFQKTLQELSDYQISELAEYAIANHTKMKMDRIESLSKASHKNIFKAIELYKAAQED